MGKINSGENFLLFQNPAMEAPFLLRNTGRTRDVILHKKLLEGNGKIHSHHPGTVLRMGREPGIFL